METKTIRNLPSVCFLLGWFSVKRTINRAGSLDPDAIIAALEDTDFEGAAGRYYFPFGSGNTPEDAGEPAYMWHQWPEVPLLFLQYTESGQNSDDVEVIWPATYRTSEGAVVRPE